MQRVIVTVQRNDDSQVRDLEVPAELESERLAELIATALRWDTGQAGGSSRYTIEAQPLGRILQPHESLADIGAWDGSWLVLYPVVAISAQAPVQPSIASVTVLPTRQDAPDISVPPQEPGSVISGWRSLGIDLPSAPTQEQEAQDAQDDYNSAPTFSWKQLDD